MALFPLLVFFTRPASVFLPRLAFSTNWKARAVSVVRGWREPEYMGGLFLVKTQCVGGKGDLEI
jgi:hypothetical protein